MKRQATAKNEFVAIPPVVEVVPVVVPLVVVPIEVRDVTRIVGVRPFVRNAIRITAP